MILEKNITNTANILQWPVPATLMADPMVTNARLLAKKYSSKSVNEILDIYVKVSDVESVRRLFDNILRYVGTQYFFGRGVELGAGIAMFSAFIAAEMPKVKEIYAVEVVPEVVSHLQPKVVEAVAGPASSKVVPVIGSFDELKLDDASCDFAIEIASLHHSNDVAATLRELARVLRADARLVAFDRAHRNELTDCQRNFMLDIEYSGAWLEKNGFSMASLTRRQNGEREYRIDEWVKFFQTAGFELEKRLEVRTTGWSEFLRSCVLHLPFKLRKRMGWLPSRVCEHTGETWWRFKRLIGFGLNNQHFVEGENSYSVFVARRI